MAAPKYFAALTVLALVVCVEAESNKTVIIVLKQALDCFDLPTGRLTAFKDLRLKAKTRKIYTVYGNLVIEKAIAEPFSLVGDIVHCETEDDETGCRRTMVLDIPNACTQIPLKDRPWSAFIEALQGFVPKCPLKPGTYPIDGFERDVEQLSSYSLNEGYYKMKTYVNDRFSRPLGCLEMRANVRFEYD